MCKKHLFDCAKQYGSDWNDIILRDIFEFAGDDIRKEEERGLRSLKSRASTRISMDLSTEESTSTTSNLSSKDTLQVKNSAINTKAL